MVLGIILIVIGILGAITTLVYGIKFMRKNDILLKSAYVGMSSNSSKKVNEEQSYVKENLETNYLDEVSNDTEMLDDVLINKEKGNSLDTEILM